MNCKYLIVAVACIGLGFAAHGGAVEIENFKSGLVCEENFETPEAKTTLRWICFETETIYVTGQGECVYDSREEECTWYGIEFDYENLAEDEEIWCVSTSSSPVNIGTPRGVTDEDVTRSEYQMKVESGSGHEFISGYSVASSRQGHESVIVDETICSVDGEEIFRYRFTTIQPRLDKQTAIEALQRARIYPKSDFDE